MPDHIILRIFQDVIWQLLTFGRLKNHLRRELGAFRSLSEKRALSIADHSILTDLGDPVSGPRGREVHLLFGNSLSLCQLVMSTNVAKNVIPPSYNSGVRMNAPRLL